MLTYRSLPRGARFRWNSPGSANYRKLGHDRYQLLTLAGTPVLGMTYNLRDRQGYDNPVTEVSL